MQFSSKPSILPFLLSVNPFCSFYRFLFRPKVCVYGSFISAAHGRYSEKILCIVMYIGATNMAETPKRKRAFRKYSYRGVDLDQLLELSTDQVCTIIPNAYIFPHITLAYDRCKRVFFAK